MDISEKRVYADRTGATDAFLATAAGVARVSVSADQVGEFGLVRRDEAADVAGADGRLAVAAEDVFVAGRDADDGLRFAGTGFGPATAVGFDGETLYAAGEGRVARYAGDGWERTGSVSNVRAIDGDLVAAAGGVFRVDGSHVGLSDARDVATAGTPLAATGDGLYYLANGWMRAVEGPFVAVVAEEGRAHAATADALYRRTDGEWTETDGPASGLAALAHAPDATYAVTETGRFCVDAGEGWRTRSLGLPDVRSVAVP